MLFRVLLLCAFALAFVRGNSNSCKRFPIPVDLGTPLPEPLPGLFELIDEYFQEVMDQNGVVGGALSLRYKGKQIFSTGKGYADVVREVPFTPQTKTRVASVSKLLTVILLNQHASQGILNIHDPVRKWCPDFVVPDRFTDVWKFGGGDITFFHLAAHLSGLQREAPPVATTAAVLDALWECPLVVPTGSVPSYSNLGISLLGNALVDCVNKNTTFAKLLDKYIVQPLNLTNTGVTYTPSVMASLAKGYIGSQEVPFADLGWSDPSGGIYASAEDLTIINDAILADAARDVIPSPSNNTLGIKPTLARALLEPVSRNPDGLTYIGAPWEMTAFDPLGARSSRLLTKSSGKDIGQGYDESSRLRHQGAESRQSDSLFMKKGTKEIRKRFTPFIKLDSSNSNYQHVPISMQTLRASLAAREANEKRGVANSLRNDEDGPTRGGAYLVRTKGGSLPGYSAITVAVPELSLSIAAVWNGPIMSSAVFDVLMPYIIDGFEQALYPIADKNRVELIIGPDPDMYVGEYVSTLTGGRIVIVRDTYEGEDTLILYLLDFGLQLGVYLVHVAEGSPIGTLYRAYVPPELDSCLFSELLAFSGQFANFAKDASGPELVVTAVQIQGIAPGVVYYKV